MKIAVKISSPKAGITRLRNRISSARNMTVGSVVSTGGCCACCPDPCNCCGIRTTCCQVPIPRILTATFSGSLAAIGTVQLVWNGTGAWETTTAACGGNQVSVLCMPPNLMAVFVSTLTNFFIAKVADRCNPFLLTGTSTTTGVCSGTGSVVVTA